MNLSSTIRLLLSICLPLLATSVVAAGDPIHLHAAANPAGGDLQLAVGLALDNGDPATCGSATALDVHAGDAVNFCYTLTNLGSSTLAYHTLVDSVDGELFAVVESNPRFGPLAFQTLESFFGGKPVQQNVVISDKLYNKDNASAELGNAY